MEPKSKLRLGLGALALVALAIPALSLGAANTVELTAKLKGANEVPGPGDTNGKGDVTVELKAKKKKVCFSLEYSKLDGVAAGHIHKGDSETAGPVKVTLFEDSIEEDAGVIEDCVKKVKRKLIRKIARSPEKWYVNVHNADFPEGAIRGQLEPTER